MGTKTPISLLQELQVKQCKPLPQYCIRTLAGNTPVFECTVSVGNITATATAFSKQDAKHESAKLILSQLGCTCFLPPANSASVGQFQNFVGRLNEMASQNGLPYPTYSDCMAAPLQFKIKCEFGILQSYGIANNKKDAKQIAASEMLAKLKQTDLQSIFTNKNNSSTGIYVTTSTAVDDLAAKLYKELSFNVCKERNIPTVEQNLPAVPSNYIIYDDLNTVEDIKEMLTASGAIYTVELFQAKPLILMLKIQNTDQIIMETGNVYEKVYFNLLKKSLIFYNSKVNAKK